MEKTIKLEKQQTEIDICELEISKGPDKGKKFRLSSRETIIGTSPTCDINLSDPTVSRQHARIIWDERNKLFQIEDLGSTNGTYLNDVRIISAFLSGNGINVKIGNTELVFRAIGKKKTLEIFPEDNFFGCIGRSLVMKEIFASAFKIAQTELNILIEGETGVGKEELAKAIHLASPRKDGNFVICDLTTIDKNLFLSELFGYEKGAFTGAEKSKEGLVSASNRGTLFLDEIGEIPPQDQVQLLRFVEKKEFRPIGSTKNIYVDTRIISATSRNISDEIEKGNFRSDLFFRLAQFRIKIPPLRERKEDIFPLIRYFLHKLSGNEKETEQLYEQLYKNFKLILGYSWPGNVRELKNFVERFYNMWKITNEFYIELPIEQKIQENTPADFKSMKQKVIEEFEKNYVKNLYLSCKGNISECARVAKINRKYMEKLVKKYIRNE